eukprot:gene1237-biopygen1227
MWESTRLCAQRAYPVTGSDPDCRRMCTWHIVSRTFSISKKIRQSTSGESPGWLMYVCISASRRPHDRMNIESCILQLKASPAATRWMRRRVK